MIEFDETRPAPADTERAPEPAPPSQRPGDDTAAQESSSETRYVATIEFTIPKGQPKPEVARVQRGRTFSIFGDRAAYIVDQVIDSIKVRVMDPRGSVDTWVPLVLFFFFIALTILSTCCLIAFASSRESTNEAYSVAAAATQDIDIGSSAGRRESFSARWVPIPYGFRVNGVCWQFAASAAFASEEPTIVGAEPFVSRDIRIFMVPCERQK